MTKEQIYKECVKLILACHEATTAYTFYLNQYIKLVEELEAIKASNAEKQQEIDVQNPTKATFTLNEELVHIRTGLELVKHLQLMRDKYQRKRNEANQRLNTFRKRHGIEDKIES